MDFHKNVVFALSSTKTLGAMIARAMGSSLSELEERNFPDGEYKTRSLVDVADKNVLVIESLHGEATCTVHDKLCRLLFFVSSLKDAGARHITVIAPYLCYSRKDRRTKSRDPVATRYIARVFEVLGTDRMVTLDVHNLQAFENAFQIPTLHVEAKEYLASFLAAKLKGKKTVVLSPDAGGIKRATAFAEVLGRLLETSIPVAVMHKTRSEGVVSGTEAIFGDVAQKTVLIIDDLISSGTTLVRAAKACKKGGAVKVFAASTHGAFVPNANEVLKDSALDQIIITNSIPQLQLDKDLAKRKIEVVNIGPLLANAIQGTALKSAFVGA